MCLFPIPACLVRALLEYIVSKLAVYCLHNHVVIAVNIGMARIFGTLDGILLGGISDFAFGGGLIQKLE